MGVGEQHHVLHAQFGEDHRADAVVAQFLHIDLHFLTGFQADGGGEGVGARAVDDDDHARAFLGDHPHRLGEQRATRARLAEHIGEGRQRVHAHQHRLVGVELALTSATCSVPVALLR